MNGKVKIFILDDEEEAAYYLRKILIDHGFDAEVAVDPRLAFERIRRFNPDLIVLDLCMPHLGGFKFCKILKEDIHTQKIPIIINSVLVDDTDVKKAYQLGAEGYIKKPFLMEQLLQEIGRVIGCKHDHPA